MKVWLVYQRTDDGYCKEIECLHSICLTKKRAIEVTKRGNNYAKKYEQDSRFEIEERWAY